MCYFNINLIFVLLVKLVLNLNCFICLFMVNFFVMCFLICLFVVILIDNLFKRVMILFCVVLFFNFKLVDLFLYVVLIVLFDFIL